MLNKKSKPLKLSKYGDAPEAIEPPPKKDSMGKRIKRLRRARKLSQDQLGKQVGVTRGAVSQWEADLTDNIKLVFFLRLVEALDTKPHYLVFGRDTIPRQAPPAPANVRRPRAQVLKVNP